MREFYQLIVYHIQKTSAFVRNSPGDHFFSSKCPEYEAISMNFEDRSGVDLASMSAGYAKMSQKSPISWGVTFVLSLLIIMGGTLMAQQTTRSKQPQAQQSAGVFHPQTVTLKNGLQVVVIENHLSPAVSIALTYRVGTADDPLTMVGLSHFLEHIMFKGTRDIPAGEFKRLIISKGGRVNAATHYDYTTYTADIALEHLEFVLQIEGDRMVNLVFDEKEILAEQQVVLEERLMRMDSHPFGQAYEVLLKNLYWHHPYGVPPIGYPHHIKAYTKAALEDHYKKWYVPNNAILVISGDVTMETVQPMVEKYFGSIPSRALPERRRVQEVEHTGLTAQLMFESDRISSRNISWHFAAPHHASAQNKYFYPLLVLAHIMGGNSNSRLYRALVDDDMEDGSTRQYALDVSADYDGDNLNPMDFSVSVTLHPGTTEEEVKKIIQDQLKALTLVAVTPEELKKAKRDLLAGVAFARDGNAGAIRTFLRLAMGFTIDDVEEWPDSIQKVTADQILEAAQFVFSKDPLVVLHLYPKKKQEEALKPKAPEPQQKSGVSS